jgi:hypothetical protein
VSDEPRQPPAPEVVAEALPREITLEQLVLALIGLGIPAEVAAWVTEVQLDPKTVEVEVVTSLRHGARVRVSIPIDDRAGVPWGAIGGST